MLRIAAAGRSLNDTVCDLLIECFLLGARSSSKSRLEFPNTPISFAWSMRQ
jgi:hypothetical protein